jgi:hypothetical protein
VTGASPYAEAYGSPKLGTDPRRPCGRTKQREFMDTLRTRSVNVDVAADGDISHDLPMTQLKRVQLSLCTSPF